MTATAVTTWRTVGASAVGTSHLRDGLGCQDAWAAGRLPCERGVVAAVADGAGSAANAALGASTAAAAAVAAACADAMVDVDGEAVAVDAVRAARAALEALAASDDVPLASLACTIAVVVVTGATLGAAVVGDAGVVVRNGDDAWHVVTGDKGEYLNETVFLTSSSWATATVSARTDSSDADVAVISDGLALLAFDGVTGAAHEPFFSPLFAYARRGGDDAQLGAFLASPRVRDRTDDDVTLALLVSEPRAAS